MTGQSIFFLVLGALILYGGLIITVMINFKSQKEED